MLNILIRIFKHAYDLVHFFYQWDHELQCPPKVLEQNKIFSNNLKKCVNLKCPLQTIWSEGLIFDPYCLIPG